MCLPRRALQWEGEDGIKLNIVVGSSYMSNFIMASHVTVCGCKQCILHKKIWEYIYRELISRWMFHPAFLFFTFLSYLPEKPHGLDSMESGYWPLKQQFASIPHFMRQLSTRINGPNMGFDSLSNKPRTLSYSLKIASHPRQREYTSSASCSTIHSPKKKAYPSPAKKEGKWKTLAVMLPKWYPLHLWLPMSIRGRKLAGMRRYTAYSRYQTVVFYVARASSILLASE